jgi:acetoacetate decarboxylase
MLPIRALKHVVPLILLPQRTLPPTLCWSLTLALTKASSLMAFCTAKNSVVWTSFGMWRHALAMIAPAVVQMVLKCAHMAAELVMPALLAQVARWHTWDIV